MAKLIVLKAHACLVAGAAVLVLMLARVMYFYAAADDALVGVIPDDAFYYLQLARHRVSDGFWTFDGTSPATGFHFLYGHLLALIYSVFGDLPWRQLFLLVGLLASIAIAASAYLTSRTVETLFGRELIPIALAPYFTAASLVQSTAMMESWLVLLFSALTIFVVPRDKPAGLRSALGLVVLGILGSLARTDYGMLPGVLFCVFLVGLKFQTSHLLVRSALVLAGAVIGLLIVHAQNYGISGQFLQASAQTKLHWSEVYGHAILSPLSLVGSVAFPFVEAVYEWLDPMSDEVKWIALIAAAFAIAFLLMALFVGLKAEQDSLRRLLFAGCALTLIGYVLFYRLNSTALQEWYASNVLVPAAIVLSGIVSFIFTKRAAWPAIAGLLVYSFGGVASLFSVTWPHQAVMMQAGLFVRNTDPHSKYAAWNAGIVSYFAQRPIVNIDGLVNDEVLPFVMSNTLFDYVKVRHIDYIVDYERMITDPYLRRRGGYEEARTDKCLNAVHAVDTYIKVYKIVPGCL